MHLRATQTENEYLAGATRVEEQAPAASDRADADSRALQGVRTGSLSPQMDAGAARSIQRMAGNAAFTTAVQRAAAATEYDSMDGSSVHDALGKPSERLPDTVQRDLSRGYGMDLSGMEVVRDDASTKDTNSAAYTAGGKVVVPSDFSYEGSGKETIAHEATHWITQNTHGQAEGTPVAGGVSVSNPNDHYEVEAHANGQAVANGGFANVASAGISSASVQRMAEESVQREAIVQREAGKNPDMPDDELEVDQMPLQREEEPESEPQPEPGPEDDVG